MNDETNLIEDIMPNNGEAFHHDEDDGLTESERDDARAEREEHNMMRSAGVTLTDTLITWLEKEIAATDSVRAVKTYAESSGIPEATVLEAYNIVRSLLEQKREELIQLKEEHLA
jgi:hypothetical protein